MNELQIEMLVKSIFEQLENRLTAQIEERVGWNAIWEKRDDTNQIILCQLGMDQDYFRLTHWVVGSPSFFGDKYNKIHHCELFIAATSGEAAGRAQAYWVEHLRTEGVSECD